MINANNTTRVVTTDLEAPESTLNEMEAQSVTGGGGAASLLQAGKDGYQIGKALDEAFGFSNRLGDAAYKKWGALPSWILRFF